MAKAVAAPGFAGFRPAALAFFRDLAAKQDRTWFQDNRETYEAEVLAPLRELVALLSAELPRRGIPLSGEPSRAIFRIHRDVRFSKDKSPYKTHAGALLTRNGANAKQPGGGVLYIHIDPQGSFTAAGFYQPEPARLAAMRTALVAKPKRFLDAIERLSEANAELSMEDALSRLPRGFEHAAESPVAPYLRLRSLIARRSLSVREVQGTDLLERLTGFAEIAAPLLRFGWDAV